MLERGTCPNLNSPFQFGKVEFQFGWFLPAAKVVSHRLCMWLNFNMSRTGLIEVLKVSVSYESALSPLSKMVLEQMSCQNPCIVTYRKSGRTNTIREREKRELRQSESSISGGTFSLKSETVCSEYVACLFLILGLSEK